MRQNIGLKVASVTATALFFLVGCVSPTSSSSNTELTVSAPTVTASISDTSVTPGSTVTLTATATSGATLLWSQVTGNSVSLSGATSAIASFTPSVSGVYSFHVVATNAGGSTTSNTISVTVSATAPMVSAGISETSGVLFDIVSLTATATSGASLLWTEVSAPSGSTAAILDGSTAFARIVPDVAGVYVFSVTATNSGGSATSNTVSVSIVDPLAGTWVNSYPNGSITMTYTFTFANGIWSNIQTNSSSSNTFVASGTYVENSAGVVVLSETNAVQTIGGVSYNRTRQDTATFGFVISGGVINWTLQSGTLLQISDLNPYTKQ